MSEYSQDTENLLVDLVRDILEASKKSIDKSIPCIVTKVVSRTKVNVRPLIKVIDKGGNAYDRDEIEGIPTFTAGAGDTFISFPVKADDIGWLDACDRDISLFLQSYANSEPPTKRMHSFSDARFIPDIMTNITVAAEDVTAVVIQNRSGTVKIALDQSQIRVRNETASVVMDGNKITASTAESTIEIDGGSVNGTAPNGFNLNGFTIDASGAAVSPVSVTSPSMVAAGKELAGHDHDSGNLLDSLGGAVTGKTAGNN